MIAKTSCPTSKFKELVKQHKSANHPLFDLVESLAKSNKLNAGQYNIFVTNIAVRTMLSLSEIHACCIQASLDLDPLRTAYSVRTGAEEGGDGRPKEVHSLLMMNAINYHGSIAYGLPPIDLKYFMHLIRLVHSLRRFQIIFKLESKYGGISKEQDLLNIFNSEELVDIIRRACDYLEITISEDDLKHEKKLKKLEAKAIYLLKDSNVIQVTIDYCLAQLDLLSNMKTGYLQGVGFAHEALADEMIYKMFRIMYSQISLYPSEEEFENNVYPYYKAHGNYIEVYNGQADETEGVEVTHAKRELEKLLRLDETALDVAWEGANNFANRNGKIWDVIHKLLMNQKI